MRSLVLNGSRRPSHARCAIAFFGCGYSPEIWWKCLRVDANEYFDDPTRRLAPDAESIILLANPVQPHSEGEIVLKTAKPADHPTIRMNYFCDPHDMQVMLSVLRRTLDIAANWPGARKLGPLLVPPHLARQHNHRTDTCPTDALLEDLVRHYAMTVYHLTSTCRIGDVVDPPLRVLGIDNLRVADASVTPNVISGNTNAPCIMIGEKAAEMLAIDHNVEIADFVGEKPPSAGGNPRLANT